MSMFITSRYCSFSLTTDKPVSCQQAIVLAIELILAATVLAVGILGLLAAQGASIGALNGLGAMGLPAATVLISVGGIVIIIDFVAAIVVVMRRSLDEQGRVVFVGRTSKGDLITVRYPQASDAEAMWNYINVLSKERTFIRFQGEEISLEAEEKYLKSQLERIAKHTTVQLLVFCNEELIGWSEIDMEDKAYKHRGTMGISIAKEFRGKGVGSHLMSLVIGEAIKNLPGLEMITLCVFATNAVGIRMYERFGFTEYGKLPSGIKLEGKHVDQIYMYKEVSGF